MAKWRNGEMAKWRNGEMAKIFLVKVLLFNDLPIKQKNKVYGL
jgi:hypothetical protein